MTTTPAMTAQEALAELRSRRGLAYQESEEVASTLERALSDADRRATEAVRISDEIASEKDDLEQRAEDLHSRLSAVEAERDKANRWYLDATMIEPTAEITRADLIKAMRGSQNVIDATVKERDDLQSRLSAVEARCGLMREALRPFAEAADVGDEQAQRIIGATGLKVHDNSLVRLSFAIGDLRRARSILAYPGGKSEEKGEGK